MLALTLTMGIVWTVTYGLIIRRSALDKAHGMPMPALCLNVSWEFMYSVVAPHHAPQVYINWMWLLFDVVIFAQYVRYGAKEMPRGLPARLFLPTLAVTLCLSFSGVLAAGHDFHDPDGMYSAFAMNMVMSVLFIAMLFRRGDVRAQSLYIALGKLVGSLSASILFFVQYPDRWLLCVFYVATLVLDVAYAALLARRSRELGIDPWRRV